MPRISLTTPLLGKNNAIAKKGFDASLCSNHVSKAFVFYPALFTNTAVIKANGTELTTYAHSQIFK